MLTDDPSFTEGMPTRQNILRAMYWLVEGVRPGDSLFFHFSGTWAQRGTAMCCSQGLAMTEGICIVVIFSGHGGSVRDQSGDEYDGMYHSPWLLDVFFRPLL